MPRSRRQIQPLAPADARELAAFWEAGGFDASHPGEGLAAPEDVESEEAWIRRTLDGWGDCGRLIFGDDGLIAFVKYAPSEYFGARAGGIACRVSADAVLLAGLCVSPPLAGQGFAKLLLSSVERDLARRGLPALEAFAVGRGQHVPSALRPLDFYERNGFRLKAPDPVLPLVRLEMRALVSWTENLDAVLEGLLSAAQLPRPRRAPAPTGP